MAGFTFSTLYGTANRNTKNDVNIQIGCNYLFHLIYEVRQVNKETCPLVVGVVEEAGQLGQEG
jgi:hypothetical protein